MAIFFVKINVLAEKRKEVWQTIDSLAAQIKKEKGCEASGFYQNAADENDILFLTTWRDRNALDAYLKSIHFTVLLGIRSLLSREPTIRICESKPFHPRHDRQPYCDLCIPDKPKSDHDH
ncbi:MAG: antibiotic biosynthesis monooxygenase family protein [Desulfobacterales bacterium]|nr:antibiotic biosynthesis monooxygenase family protein [Desulfobacterales bacterium]